MRARIDLPSSTDPFSQKQEKESYNLIQNLSPECLYIAGDSNLSPTPLPDARSSRERGECDLVSLTTKRSMLLSGERPNLNYDFARLQAHDVLSFVFSGKQAGRVGKKLFLFLILIFFCGAFSASAQSFPPVHLRGYGSVSAIQKVLRPGSSLLTIQCESDSNAKLLLAKYLSDISLLPPVDPSEIAAGRLGNRVFLAADKLGRAPSLLPTGTIQKAEMRVPMWLDRWDRFGFRFYTRQWETPPNENIPPYDVLSEFDFAKKTNTGMIFWADQSQLDTSEGMMQDSWWEWAQREAKSAEIPVGINLQAVPANWLVNRYREDTTYKMPQYIGGFYKVGDPWLGGMGWFSWASKAGENAQLGLLQSEVKRRASDPNVVTFLEPHGELKHGNHDLFLEYGPAADIAFRAFLKRRYKSIETLNSSWGAHFTKWEAVRVPEIASFEGWGLEAIDLTGQWKIGYEAFEDGKDRFNWELANKYTQKIATVPAPSEWFSPEFDDSPWPTVTAPGHDIAMLWPKRPAVLRRHITLPWHKSKLYLYIWDLNLGFQEKITAAVNGLTVGESRVQWDTPHWCAYDVTDAVKRGDNLIAIRVPKGFFGYRVYLSSKPPHQYPNLGKFENTRWVDLCDGLADARLDTLKRGVEMIRQVDKNRQIVLMSPDPYANGDKILASDFGGEFHDTGYMSGFWADFDPMLMRSSGLPFSLEAGSPPGSLAELKKFTGLWHTEGINGVDYFQQIGDIFWKPEFKKYFEENQHLYHLFGKYHAPKASVAVLYSDRVQRLVGYPWQPEPNKNMQNGYWDIQGGYWRFNVAANLLRSVERDGVTEDDFPRGNAAQYKLIFDSGTSVMDDAFVNKLEKYVREGGVFVTFGQTGRHSSTVPDSWPICRLTGTRVVRIDPHDKDGNSILSHKLVTVQSQKIVGTDWNGVRANGLGLVKAASGCRDLLRWDDGTSAAVIRPIGKGYVIHLGVKFSGDRIPDRIAGAAETTADQNLTRLLLSFCDWRGVPRIPAKVEARLNQHVLMRHYLSNNGLWDIWALWNESETNTAEARLLWKEYPGYCKEIKDGKITKLTGRSLDKIEFAALETRIFLTPRSNLSEAPSEWLTLQKSWWKASKKPLPVILPMPEPKWGFPLTDDWKTDTEDRVRLGIMRNSGSGRVQFKRKFTVPSGWKDGRTQLWLYAWTSTTFVGKGTIYLDGVKISGPFDQGIAGVDLTDRLLPGSTHTVTVVVESSATIIGSRGSCWLWHRPKPEETLDPAGTWHTTTDGIHTSPDQKLPGNWSGSTALRHIVIPAKLSNRSAMLAVESSAGIVGTIINGHYIRRHHHKIGNHLDLNITPWIHFGERNEIQIVTWDGPSTGQVDAIHLVFFNRLEYP